MASVAENLLTAEEYGAMPDDGRMTELVRGRIVELPPPHRRHGMVRFKAGWILGNFVVPRDLGHIFTNDAGFITVRDPDTVRGPDVAYCSYARMPKRQVPANYSGPSPELIFEIRSPNDRTADVDEKVAEYLAAGVLAVCLLDPEGNSATVHRSGDEPMILGPDDDLTFPGILDGFSARVGSFVE